MKLSSRIKYAESAIQKFEAWTAECEKIYAANPSADPFSDSFDADTDWEELFPILDRGEGLRIAAADAERTLEIVGSIVPSMSAADKALLVECRDPYSVGGETYQGRDIPRYAELRELKNRLGLSWSELAWVGYADELVKEV